MDINQLKEKKTALILFLFSLFILYMASTLVKPQASMDAAYYHIMADKLQQEKGFEEPVVWHYLHEYDSLKHPMDYWMPLGIILYRAARIPVGDAGEVLLNIILWSFLLALVFFDVKKQTESYFYSIFAALTLLFCGRNLFYLLTTDNIVFYAVLGYLFLRTTGRQKQQPFVSAILAGLITLTRIEGIIIAAFAGFLILFHSRSIKQTGLYMLVFLLVISPWMIRNYITLGQIWTSNTGALFIQNYEDLFKENYEGSLTYMLEPGMTQLASQRFYGLWDSFLNLIVVPSQFLFLPLWLIAVVKLRNRFIFNLVSLVGLFWLLCGVVFTHQAIKGTTMHISAFFYGAFAYLSGCGFYYLQKHKKYRQRFINFVAIVLLGWVVTFSSISIYKLNNRYSQDNGPYIELFKQFKFDPGAAIVSAYPIYVYFLSEIPGAVSGFLDVDTTVSTAQKFSCNYILLDSRANNTKATDYSEWQVVEKNKHLTLLKRDIK
ncbi:MAG: hypothetical protein ACQETH_08215 [Candidatus Rifleibacteriota bacterium]